MRMPSFFSTKPLPDPIEFLKSDVKSQLRFKLRFISECWLGCSGSKITFKLLDLDRLTTMSSPSRGLNLSRKWKWQLLNCESLAGSPEPYAGLYLRIIHLHIVAVFIIRVVHLMSVFLLRHNRLQNAQQTVQHFAAPLHAGDLTAQINGKRSFRFRFDTQFGYHIQECGKNAVAICGDQRWHVQQQTVQHMQWILLDLHVNVSHGAAQIRRYCIEKWGYYCRCLRGQHNIESFITLPSHLLLRVQT